MVYSLLGGVEDHNVDAALMVNLLTELVPVGGASGMKTVAKEALQAVAEVLGRMDKPQAMMVLETVKSTGRYSSSADIKDFMKGLARSLWGSLEEWTRAQDPVEQDVLKQEAEVHLMCDHPEGA